LKRAALACVLAAAGLAAGCNQEMRNDSRLKPFEPSPVFADGRSSRQFVPGTVAHRADRPVDVALTQGVGQDGQPIATIPVPITPELLAVGKKNYDIFCSVCHGQNGYGDGIVARRGFPAPPSYHIDRLRRAPSGHIYDVITNGYGVMYSYRDRIPTPEERWAVAAYVKTLQFSQYATQPDLPAEELTKVQSNVNTEH
jgi:mono/diheme cytochrome c family protein